MPDFSRLADDEIVQFIADNSTKFASEMSSQFPANIIEGLAAGRLITIREKHGFAIAYRGRHNNWGGGHIPADLIFLYVEQEFEGQGIGSRIVRKVKAKVTPGVSTVLSCEGCSRKLFFERQGFQQTNLGIDDLFKMQFHPQLA